ncbi:MAG: restriction endonuclease [Candidatus Peregrinibacteria bacterium]
MSKKFVDRKAFERICSMSDIRSLSPQAFEYFSKFLLEELGYSHVQVSQKIGKFHADGGVDIRARHNGAYVIGQCKLLKKGRAGLTPVLHVRALGGSMKETKAVASIFVSTLPFGKKSRIHAIRVNMSLIGPSEIASVMKKVNPSFKE